MQRKSQLTLTKLLHHISDFIAVGNQRQNSTFNNFLDRSLFILIPLTKKVANTYIHTYVLSTMPTIQLVIKLTVAWLLVGIAFAASTGFPLEGIGPDPFVAASPLVMGVVCSDGILLLAVHSIFCQDTESTLLLRSPEDIIEESNNSNNKNLPTCYRGPFRIHSLHQDSALVCAGWRADAKRLVDHLLSSSNSETTVFGRPATNLAYQASQVLANFCISSSTRNLSCVGLLAQDHKLWVVDATGAYTVRAHALGTNSQKANRVLRQQANWKTMDSQQVQEYLLEKLFEKDEDSTIVPEGSRIELALVTPRLPPQKVMKRLLASATREQQ